MALGPVVSAPSVISANVLANVADVQDFVQPYDLDDIGPAINRVLRSAEQVNSKISVVKLNRGSYDLNTPILLPSLSTNGLPQRLNFDFRGVILDAPGIVAFQRLPTQQTQAVAIIDKLVPVIEGVEVKNATIGFDIAATYGLQMQHCKATSCGTGYRVSFGLSAYLFDCYATACTNYGFLIQTGNGLWNDSSIANCASNVTTLKKCRSWSNQYDCIQIAVLASDSVHLDDCITEGNACKYEVFFDAQGSTVVKGFYIEKHHCECTNPDTLFRLILRDMTCTIEGVDRGAIPARLLDVSGSIPSRLDISGWHYLQGYSRTAWSAGSFAAGTRRQHGGKLYTATSAVTAADTPGVSANWRDEGWSGAFISESVELGAKIHAHINDHTTLFDPNAWRCNGVNALPKQLSTDYYDTNGLALRCADGITLNANRELFLDSDLDHVYIVASTLRVNGTALNVP